MSPICSKADLNFFGNWVKLLHCESLKDTQGGPSGDSSELSLTTQNGPRANTLLITRIYCQPGRGYLPSNLIDKRNVRRAR